jgi:acyl carrier protein
MKTHSESIHPFWNLSEAELRKEFAANPPDALDAALQLQAARDPAAFRKLLLALLEQFLPRARRRSLAGLPESTRLVGDLGIDSLSLAELAFKLDELFGVRVETRELAGIQTVGELLHFAERKLADQLRADAPLGVA